MASIRDVVANLKAVLNDKDEVDLEFDILTDKIKPNHIYELEKRCPVKYQESTNMLKKIKP